MEQFDIEALMNKLDVVGFNALVLINLEGLDIDEAELKFMLETAAAIYSGEIDDEIEPFMHQIGEKGSTCYYIAMLHENGIAII